MTRDLEYWRDRLEGLDEPPLLTDLSRSNEPERRSAQRRLLVEGATAAGLRDLCQSESVTSFMTVLAALDVVLHRHTGESDVTVGTPVAGRTRPEIERLIGCFLNTLVIRTTVDGEASFRTLLEQVKRESLDAQDHQSIPFERLLNELDVSRELGRTPLFQVFLNMLEVPDVESRVGDLRIKGLPAAEIGAKFDLTLYVNERSDSLEFLAVYDSGVFSEGRIGQILEQLERVLAQVVANPGIPVDRIRLDGSDRADLPDPQRALGSEWRGSVGDHLASHRRTRAVPHRDPGEAGVVVLR